MSFFSSLQQYVTSGVAGLGLNPRRFSLSRQESTEATTPAASPSPMMSSGGSSIGSYGAMGGSGGVGMGSGATGGPASLGTCLNRFVCVCVHLHGMMMKAWEWRYAWWFVCEDDALDCILWWICFFMGEKVSTINIKWISKYGFNERMLLTNESIAKL